MKTGGRLSVLVFGPADANPLQWLPTRIVREAAGLPPLKPGEPGMFALGEPGCLECAFQTAGFVDVSAQAVGTSRCFGPAAEAVWSLRDMLPSVHAILRAVDESAHDRAWAEIEAALRPSKGPMDW